MGPARRACLAAVSASMSRRRRNERRSRCRTRSVRAARSAGEIGRAARNATPSGPEAKTPSVTQACRCTWRMSAEPNRLRNETAPSLGCADDGAFSARDTPAASQSSRSISSRKIVVSAVTASGRSARNKRSRLGTEITHCRTGTGGMTWSTRCAAVAPCSDRCRTGCAKSDKSPCRDRQERVSGPTPAPTTR